MEFQRCFLFSILFITSPFQLFSTATATATLPVIPPDPQAIAKSKAFIFESCKSTAFPDICNKTLSGAATVIQESPLNLAYVGIDNARAMYIPVIFYIYENYKSPIIASLKKCKDNINNGQQKMSESGALLLKQKSRIDIIVIEAWINTAYGGVRDCLTDLNRLKESKEKRDLIGLASELQKYIVIAKDLVKLYAITKQKNGEL